MYEKKQKEEKLKAELKLEDFVAGMTLTHEAENKRIKDDINKPRMKCKLPKTSSAQANDLVESAAPAESVKIKPPRFQCEEYTRKRNLRNHFAVAHEGLHFNENIVAKD